MRKYYMSVIVGILIVATLVALAYLGLPHSGKDNLTAVSVRLAWIPGVTFIGDYVAKEKGFWRDEGLDVTLNPGGFEFDAIKLVASGSDTFGVASGPQILQARAAGVPVVAIGATIPRSPIGWIAKKDSGIKTPYDFVGRRIGAQFGTHSEITFDALMAKLDIPVNKIDQIPVKFDPRPFVVGTVDVLPVYIIDQPIDLEAQGIALNVIDPHIYGVSLAYGNVYFTTENTLRDRPDLVKRFLVGARRGWLWANANPDNAIDILSAHMAAADKSILREKLDAMFSFIKNGNNVYGGVVPMDFADWQRTYDIMQKFGGVKGSLDVNMAFTNSFVGE